MPTPQEPKPVHGESTAARPATPDSLNPPAPATVFHGESAAPAVAGDSLNAGTYTGTYTATDPGLTAGF